MADKRGPGRPRIAKEDAVPKIDTAVKTDGMTPQQTPKSTVQVDETAPTIYKMLADSGQIDPSKIDYSTFINDLIPDGIAAKYGMKLATVTELAGNGDPKLMVSGGGNPSNGEEQPPNIVSMKDVTNAVNSMNLQKVLNAQITDLVGDPTNGGTQTASDGVGQLMNGLMQMTMIEMLVNKMGGGHQAQQQQPNAEVLAMKAQLDAMEKKNEMHAVIAPLQSQITSMEKIIRDLSVGEKKTDPIMEGEMRALREDLSRMTKMNEFSDALKQTVEPLQKQIDEIGTKHGSDAMTESMRRESEVQKQNFALQNQNLEQRFAGEIQRVHDSIPMYQDPTEQIGKTVELIQQVGRITNPDASEEDRGMEIFKTAAEHLGPTLTELAAGYKESQHNRASERGEAVKPPAPKPKPIYECPGCGASQELGNEAQREATCTNCGADVVLDPRTKTVDLAIPLEMEQPEPLELSEAEFDVETVQALSGNGERESVHPEPPQPVERNMIEVATEPTMSETALRNLPVAAGGIPPIMFALDK